MKILIVLSLLCQTALAQIRSSLYKKPDPALEVSVNKTAPTTTVRKNKKAVPTLPQSGNLPGYFSGRGHFTTENSPVILPTQKQNIKSNDLLNGEVIYAEIKESLIAFNDSKAPVRATIKSGKLKGSILIGEATLEKNSKRILIDFKKLRILNSNQNYEITGYALDYKGILGLEGNLISDESKFFAAEFLSAAAAGVADASIERNQNAYGNYVENPSTDTVAKKALVSALSTTTNHFSEKLKKAPEYSVLEGTFEIQVLITEQPTLIN